MASSRAFASFFLLVSLFTCFDHFIGVFDYSVGPCFLVIKDGDDELFSNTKLF